MDVPLLAFHLALRLEMSGDTPAEESPTRLAAFDSGLRFPGQRFAPETQSHYVYFRDYEPGSGPHLESDPIGLEGDLEKV
ncbi:MAG: RHS repeat-associated core domain-containing protein [Dokdonella sp.]